MPVVDQKSKYEDRLKDYVDVKTRIGLFYAAHPDGRLVTDRVEIWQDDGVPRVVVKALAYRTVDDPHPGVGWSWMTLPGTTNFTRGSEAENTETSAWGRAIASLGIGIDASIASANEIAAKEGAAVIPAPEKTDDGGLIGVVDVGTAKDSDYELRQTPTGWALGFRLKANGRGGIKVVAHDALAEAMAIIKNDVVGNRVTCWGRISDEEFTPKNSTRVVRYQVLQLERIQTPDIILPAVSVEPDTVPLFAEGDLDEG